MSHAIRCDRCGEYFSPLAQNQEFGHIDEYFTRNDASIKNNEVLYRDEGIDFCPECTKAFGDFLFKRRIFGEPQFYPGESYYTLVQRSAKLRKIEEKAEEIREALGYAYKNSIEKLVWYPPSTLRREFIGPLLRLILDKPCIYGGAGETGVCAGEPAERESDAESESNG